MTGQTGDLPRRVGRYRIAAELARGGMGQVLLGKVGGPEGFDPPVVLKRILPDHARDPAFRKMFRDEARALVYVRHPNVVQLVDLGVDGDELFLAMEYVEGESLSNIRQALEARSTWLDYAAAVRIVAEAAAGAHAAHVATDEHGRALGMVHRDISPQNVMVTYGGHVKLVDFGIAKSHARDPKTTTGHVKGKYAYMAPEQCLADRVDARTDVFALGILLYELSTGRRLFSRANELLTIRAICEEPIPIPRAPPTTEVPYPPGLEAIVLKALERKPADRYASAAELRRELNVLLRELDSDGRLEERLAALMTGLFSDRAEAKREMLRTVELGTTVSAVPRADLAPDGARSAPDHSRVERARSPAGDVAAPARRWALRSLVVSMLVLGAVVWGAWGAGADTSVQVTSASEATAALPQPSSGDEPTSGTEPRQVQLAMSSEPPGAEVSLDGERLGVTPLDVSVEPRDEPRTLELTLLGHVPNTQSISLARDSRVHVSMQRRAAGRRSSGRARSDVPTEFGRFD